jgi:HD-like signal output (HDOD) protein
MDNEIARMTAQGWSFLADLRDAIPAHDDVETNDE